MHQTGHLRCNVVQMSLQSSAHQQRVGQVRDVDADNGKGVSVKQTSKQTSKQHQFYFINYLFFTQVTHLLIDTYWASLLFPLQFTNLWFTGYFFSMFSLSQNFTKLWKYIIIKIITGSTCPYLFIFKKEKNGIWSKTVQYIQNTCKWLRKKIWAWYW